MDGLMKDLVMREKLWAETPPEEVKYWFEYMGSLQKYYYRYSKERQKADAFEGRDDSGVISSRFTHPGGGSPHKSFFTIPPSTTHTPPDYAQSKIPTNELPAHFRILDNCFALGNSKRPDVSPGSPWHEWYALSPDEQALDRCRVLVVLNTAGVGRGSTVMWETNPPHPPHAVGPTPWMSEQESAAIHLERNLKEMDAMCQTGMLAVRVQVLVCEPIPRLWTDWMDSMMPHCGGATAPLVMGMVEGEQEDVPSPIQVVVVANAGNADTCHNLKSGFMEKRMQDLVLAPPYLTSNDDADTDAKGKIMKTNKNTPTDLTIKMTHPDLVSSDDHDLYIGMKWSSLITTRSVLSFLQASVDLSAAASSPRNQFQSKAETTPDGQTLSLKGPSSPFLLPSFLRVSYVSEENNKVAKWRMHGDFFHPAAWEVCKDSFEVTWIADSTAGGKGTQGVCPAKAGKDGECGQWWLYMAEEQMPTSPEVYANEVVAPLAQGGSNYAWMLTERHREEIVTQRVCMHEKESDSKKECGPAPQAVLPLGDLESFLVNFTPNSALGKKHSMGRRPGYTHEKERTKNRAEITERKALKGQTDIEKALFDYDVYPTALIRKDATLKAARGRDFALTAEKDRKAGEIGPVTVKSEYYDVTVTKPRGPVLGWCMRIARSGLCVLFAEYFRESADRRCAEACGLKKNWTPIKME